LIFGVVVVVVAVVAAAVVVALVPVADVPAVPADVVVVGHAAMLVDYSLLVALEAGTRRLYKILESKESGNHIRSCFKFLGATSSVFHQESYLNGATTRNILQLVHIHPKFLVFSYFSILLAFNCDSWSPSINCQPVAIINLYFRHVSHRSP